MPCGQVLEVLSYGSFNAVVILVLMDNALRRRGKVDTIDSFYEVVILVLMDNALRLKSNKLLDGFLSQVSS